MSDSVRSSDSDKQPSPKRRGQMTILLGRLMDHLMPDGCIRSVLLRNTGERFEVLVETHDQLPPCPGARRTLDALADLQSATPPTPGEEGTDEPPVIVSAKDGKPV